MHNNALTKVSGHSLVYVLCVCMRISYTRMSLTVDVILVMLTCCRLFVWDICPYIYRQSYEIWVVPLATLVLLFCGC